MKIIFCRHHSICEPGILKSLTRLGHEVVEFMHDREPQDYDKDYLLRLAALLQQTPDAAAVLSVCFSPIIARASKPFGIPYISYTVDSPLLYPLLKDDGISTQSSVPIRQAAARQIRAPQSGKLFSHTACL